MHTLQLLLVSEDDENGGEAPTSLLGEILRLDPGFDEGVLIRNDPVFDQDIDHLFEHVLHGHISLFLLLMGYLDNIVIWVVIGATCFVIGCLVHLHKIVLF